MLISIDVDSLIIIWNHKNKDIVNKFQFGGIVNAFYSNQHENLIIIEDYNQTKILSLNDILKNYV